MDFSQKKIHKLKPQQDTTSHTQQDNFFLMKTSVGVIAGETGII